MDSRLTKCVFRQKTKQNKTTSTNPNTYFKRYPSITVFLNSTQAGSYFNTEKKLTLKK